MAIPMEEAQRIVRGIHEKFGGWGFKAEIVTSENQVIVKSEKEQIRFGWAFGEFCALVKNWSVDIIIHEGWPAIVIW